MGGIAWPAHFHHGRHGVLGCWLLESFCWANDKFGLGAEALVLTRKPAAFHLKAPHLANHPAVTLWKGCPAVPFPDRPLLARDSRGHGASARLNAEDPLLMLDTIVEGTRRTLDFAVQCGARKFLLTSSGAVYGPQPPN